ncbi:MAG: hypothetical protein H0T79_03465 [Deltaproteobacteria bacterium]|nr:hypothetical protein [Deltaproteobacteria bacterium]
MKTVGVDLWGGQMRGSGLNGPTRMVSAPIPRTRTVRELFVRAYAKFADACRAVDEPGVALVAVDETTGHAAGLARIRARVDRHVAAIVGRHDACDLYLAAHERLALRHLVVVVDPVTSWKRGDSGVSFRMLDLRTGEGMIDEEGRTLRGLRAEGPVVIRCGGYTIFALPLGDPTDWPASADDAWACLPERVYFDELERVPQGSLVRLPMVRPAGRTITSVVHRTHGPWDTGMQLVTGGDVAGTLVVRGPRGGGQILVGQQALSDGVLLGRYGRCDSAELGGDESVSRVHALLLLVGERLLAIDTSSTNGSREVGHKNARVIEVHGGSNLELGFKTHLRWSWAS